MLGTLKATRGSILTAREEESWNGGGSLAERVAQTTPNPPALETAGTSGSSKSGGEVAKGLVNLVRIRQRAFREMTHT